MRSSAFVLLTPFLTRMGFMPGQIILAHWRGNQKTENGR